jgi:DNA-binding XRE family transcriptional regulator
MNEMRRGDTMAASIRAARAYAGVGQKEVADHLGVSRETISAWERGKTPVPRIARRGVIEGLVELSGISREVFAGRKEEK